MILYPSSRFELIDQSANPVISREEVVQPLFLMAFSSEKGDEHLNVVSGNAFYKKYGKDILYSKHGQPLLQAKRIIDEGGTILAKRVVATDATLANTAIVAKVKSEELQKRNAAGELLFMDKVTNKETTVSTGNTPIMITTAVITYDCVSISNAKDMATISTAIENEEDFEGTQGVFAYPLWLITDNGRGKSIKRFRVAPDYTGSKYLDNMKYTFNIIEKNETIETFDFTVNPDVIENTVNKSLSNMARIYSSQIKCKAFEENFKKFITKVAEISKNTYTYCLSNDILFGKEKRMNPMKNIKIDLDNGFNLSYAYGLDLENGTNGEFGDAPFGTEAYKRELVKFFDGTFSDDIYDLDKYKLDLIVDANYPEEVKRAIETLTDFREDAFYMRDMGLNLRTLDSILAANASNKPSKFIGTYHLSYDIEDPYTKKQVPVTVGYTLSKLMIKHFKSGRNRAVAGQLHDMILNEAIEGTINFLPKVTPAYNQKETLAENAINYASYFDNVLTLETLFTSQEANTQLSFINNILATQEVIKAIRTRCPKTRYSFIDGDDLQKYKDDVEMVLTKYATNFKKLKLVYMKDEAYISNKVFYAALEIEYRDFVQSEYFKVYALNSNTN